MLVLNFIFLMIGGIERFCMSVTVCMSSAVKCLFKSVVYFQNELFICFALELFIYSGFQLLFGYIICNYFLLFYKLSLHPAECVLCPIEAFCLMLSPFSIFAFVSCILWVFTRKFSCIPMT